MHVEAQKIEYWESEIARLEEEIQLAEENNDEASLIKYMAALGTAQQRLSDVKKEIYT